MWSWLRSWSQPTLSQTCRRWTSTFPSSVRLFQQPAALQRSKLPNNHHKSSLNKIQQYCCKTTRAKSNLSSSTRNNTATTSCWQSRSTSRVNKICNKSHLIISVYWLIRFTKDSMWTSLMKLKLNTQAQLVPLRLVFNLIKGSVHNLSWSHLWGRVTGDNV